MQQFSGFTRGVVAGVVGWRVVSACCTCPNPSVKYLFLRRFPFTVIIRLADAPTSPARLTYRDWDPTALDAASP